MLLKKGGPMTIGEIIKEARLKKGISLRELGEKSGVAWNTIARIERGAHKEPKLDSIRMICAALGLAGPTIMIGKKKID
jgi:transcriptional regulator with XRE-family HTH domain